MMRFVLADLKRLWAPSLVIICLVALASAEERGGLMSAFFMLSYLAFSLPAIAAGLAVGHFGLHTTSLGFGVGLVALALTALASMARRIGR